MRTVSLRAFRDSLGKEDAEVEPVEVVVRRKGYLITLGRWTPEAYLEPMRPFDDRPVIQAAAVPFSTRPFTPVPKVAPKR